jgi:hypothetical protein
MVSLYIRFSVYSPRCAHIPYIPHEKRMHQACLNLATCSAAQDREFLSGGSSSGSGVAVALGQVPHGAIWCYMLPLNFLM